MSVTDRVGGFRPSDQLTNRTHGVAAAAALTDLGPGRCIAVPQDLSTTDGCAELARQLVDDHSVKKARQPGDVFPSGCPPVVMHTRIGGPGDVFPSGCPPFAMHTRIGEPALFIVTGDLALMLRPSHTRSLRAITNACLQLDCVVHNSGCSWGEPLEEHQEKGWDKVMNLNVKVGPRRRWEVGLAGRASEQEGGQCGIAGRCQTDGRGGGGDGRLHLHDTVINAGVFVWCGSWRAHRNAPIVGAGAVLPDRRASAAAPRRGDGRRPGSHHHNRVCGGHPAPGSTTGRLPFGCCGDHQSVTSTGAP